MSYQVTARKWRPQIFDEVVGQDHVTRTIQNAINAGRIAQSYLFSGPRGVGKTTLARILVKALNCEKGPTPRPCNRCQYCEEINQNKSLDYMEIDGASNRGIDQIRDINEKLKYSSPHNKYRVFVIDEVHMLTIEAFNALLKSLEEPPPGIIFVFCTTEPHKVPATIRSRCQHYNFKSISLEQIKTQLKKILETEKIPYAPEVLFYIAKAASGSMRDSQSILDQVVAYAEAKLSKQAVLDVLGLNSSDIHFTFLRNLAHTKLAANKKLVCALLAEGRDARQFIFEVLAALQSLLYIKEGITELDMLELNQEDFDSLSGFKDDFSREDIFLLCDLCYELLRELKGSTQEQLLLDFFMTKLHRFRQLVTPEQLKAELFKLSQQVEQGSPGTGQAPVKASDRRSSFSERKSASVSASKSGPVSAPASAEGAEQKPSEQRPAEKPSAEKATTPLQETGSHMQEQDRIRTRTQTDTRRTFRIPKAAGQQQASAALQDSIESGPQIISEAQKVFDAKIVDLPE